MYIPPSPYYYLLPYYYHIYYCYPYLYYTTIPIPTTYLSYYLLLPTILPQIVSPWTSNYSTVVREAPRLILSELFKVRKISVVYKTKRIFLSCNCCVYCTYYQHIRNTFARGTNRPIIHTSMTVDGACDGNSVQNGGFCVQLWHTMSVVARYQFLFLSKAGLGLDVGYMWGYTVSSIQQQW